ncbi:MAG: penicillin-binding protein activator [Nitrospirae bacterium]|nr:penicillin-binding protein activator [Nitrospirota bacterium]
MISIFKNTFFILTVVFLIIQSSCASPAPKKDIALELQQEEEGARSAFGLGEQYYSKGDNELAIIAFKNFVSKYPNSRLIDDAYLRIGDVYLSKREYENAAVYYKKIVEMLPRTDLFSEARYKLGICSFELKRTDDALLLLSEEAKLPHPSDRKASINKYLSEIYIIKKDYLLSVKALTSALNETADESEKSRQRNRIKGIIEEYFDSSLLREITKTYPGAFPSDIALIKLIKTYIKSGDYVNAEASAKDFIASFPKHEFVPEANRLLKEIKEKPKIGRLKIGAILPLTGRLSTFGKDIQDGINLAISEHNEKKGEEPIMLIIKDSEGVPEKAVKSMEELANVDKVMAVIGPVSNKEVEAAAKGLDTLEMPAITPSAYAINLPKMSKYLFRNALTNELQAKAVVEYAINKLNLKRFVVIHPDDAYGTELKDFFTKEVVRLNGEIIHIETFGLEDVDFGGQMERIKEADLKKYGTFETTMSQKEEGKVVTVYKPGFDAVFIPAEYNKIVLIAPQLALHDIKGVTMLGTNGWNSNDLIQLGERYVDGSIFVDSFFIDSPRPIVKDFVKRYRFKYEADPTFLSAQAYDTAKILIKIFKEGAANSKDVNEALFKIKDFDGVTGRTSFDQDGEVQKNLFMIKVRRNKFIEVN